MSFCSVVQYHPPRCRSAAVAKRNRDRERERDREKERERERERERREREKRVLQIIMHRSPIPTSHPKH